MEDGRNESLYIECGSTHEDIRNDKENMMDFKRELEPMFFLHIETRNEHDELTNW
jgi:hypothetical protein